MFAAAMLIAVAVFVPPPDLRPYEAFADRLEKAVRDGDEKAYPGLFDAEAYFDRVMTHARIEPMTKNDSMETAVRATRGAWTRLFRGLTGKDRRSAFRRLRVRVVGGEVRARFRVASTGPSVNYLDFVLTPAGAAGPRVADIHIALTGSTWSHEMAPAMCPVIVRLSGREVGAEDREGVFYLFDRYQLLNRLSSEHKPRELLDEWAQLPPAVRDRQPFQTLRLRAACDRAGTDPGGFHAALAEFHRLFPSDPVADIMAIDTLTLLGQYADARRAVDQLNAAVGGDPYLFALRAALFA